MLRYMSCHNIEFFLKIKIPPLLLGQLQLEAHFVQVDARVESTDGQPPLWTDPPLIREARERRGLKKVWEQKLAIF